MNIRLPLMVVAMMMSASCTGAFAQPLNTALVDLEFLEGHWKVQAGKNTTSRLYGALERGTSDISVTANGQALIKQDHFYLVGVEGQMLGSADPVMLIYPEASTLHGEQVSGRGVVHYTATHVEHGKSVTFESTSADGTLRLTYLLKAPDTVSMTSESRKSGGTAFEVIATQTLQKDAKP